MGISSITIEGARAKNLGLKSMTMSRLGRIVALAGANGSGKSRLLACVQDVGATAHSQLGDAEKNKRRRDAFERLIDQSNPEQSVAYIKNRDRFASKLDCIDLVVWTGAPSRVLGFSPRAGELLDPSSMSPSDRTKRAKNLISIGSDAWPASALAYIQELQDGWTEATHQNRDVSVSEEDAQRKISSYERLRDDIEKLLKARLGRVNKRATLFGLPIGEGKFSQGQKMLIQLVTAIHARGADFENAVLLIDEPETHLHPRAVVEVLRSLTEAAPDSQIWLATHSIPLLAYIASRDDASLWSVEGGAAAYCGRKPETVIQSLLGSEEDLAMLSSFTSLPYHLASNTFAYQCLFEPGVSEHAEGDDQLKQIRGILSSKAKSDGRPIKVVDYGAGKGRLLASIQWEKINGNQIAIDYFAYDQYLSNRDACQKVIDEFYPETCERYFEKKADLKERLRGTVDVVVMTNVLHEIDPGEWLTLLGSGGLIPALLNDDGHLLIVEDQRIPVGERARKYGFLLLDANELRTLFGISSAEEPGFTSVDSRGDKRLRAHAIAKPLLGGISAKTRDEAIRELSDKALDELKLLRSPDKANYANGMLNGLWTQLFANAELYLRSTGGRR